MTKITMAQQHQLAVIGAAILDPAACKDTVQHLTPEMFEDGPYRQLFGAIKLQLETGHNVDAVILEKMLGTDFRPLIVTAAETVPTLSHVQDYEALVMEDYRKRLLTDLAVRVSMSAADADSICRELSEALKAQDHLRQESVDANVKAFAEVWAETMYWMEKPATNVRMAWRELDELGLFGEKMVTVLAGRPGHGKTDLALALALRLSNSCQVYYLTMEEDRRKLMMRTMSKLTRINSTRLRDRKITPEERESLNNAFSLIKGHTGLIYDDGTRMTVDDIRARVMKYRPRIVFIDHIGLITDTQPGRKEFERLADVTRSLKELAMETGITVVELVQLNRTVDRSGGARKAALGDLRGSGTIEQDADAVVFIESQVTGERRLQGPNDYFSVDLRVSKNREGETGRVAMWWQPQYHEWQPAPDPAENYNEDEFRPVTDDDGPAGW
ncbi:MAG: replicative DNA helicase [Faecalibacterium sp.]